jgi:hypothetical protein
MRFKHKHIERRMSESKCPVCKGLYGGQCKTSDGGDFDGKSFACEMCGSFKISGSALSGKLSESANQLTAIQRAALSHRIKTAQTNPGQLPIVVTTWLDRFLKDAKLPTPPDQARNIVRFIGDRISLDGEALKSLPNSLWTIVGSANPMLCYSVVKQLFERGVILGVPSEAMDRPGNMLNADLSLEGWEAYQDEKRGRLSGSYGFIALKFGDDVLDPFLSGVIKPAINKMGYSLVDMRDVAQPGLIDNIMREKIRDAAFVLVDLTHDNSGAYWEAGYAEGLGKPVLYLCEAAKFSQKKTHFDTNHCTTVIWGGEKQNDKFADELRATLKNSMRLIPTS